MGNKDLDVFPEVFQAVAGDDFVVYAYMNDGGMRRYDMKPLIKSGGVFKVLEALFLQHMTQIPVNYPLSKSNGLPASLTS